MTLLRFLLFTAATILGPGFALQTLLRVRPDPALVVPVGAAFTAGLYWLGLVTGLPWILPLAVGLVLLAAWLRRDRRRDMAPGPRLAGGLGPGLAIVAFLALTQYGSYRLASDGSFLLDNLVPYDAAFHVGLTYELVAGYPPQVPGVSGLPLGYHLGPDLVRAAALRHAGIDPWDSIARFDVTLFALALVPLLRTTAQRLALSPRAVSLMPWTLLLTDFSFVFASNPAADWWADMLRGNILLSLALANPIVPALGLALGCVIALSRYEEGEGPGYLVLASGLALAIAFFKVFLGAGLLLGFGLLGLHRLVARRSILSLLVVAIPCALATAALSMGQGATTVRVTLVPLDLVKTTLANLELPAASGGRLVVWAALWLMASLGIRVLALRRAAKASISDSPIGVPLAAIALSAWPLGLLLHVSAPEVLPDQTVVNDASFLIEQGGPALWVFTVAALDAIAGSGLRGLLVLALAGTLSLPSTVQFVVRKASSPKDPLPAAMVRATVALRAVSRPGDVVMQRPGARYPPPPVILAGCRVPYERFTPYLTQFVPREALLERHRLVVSFFRTTDREEAIAVARALDARYLALWGHDKIRFDSEGILTKVHEEEGARLFRLDLPLTTSPHARTATP